MEFYKAILCGGKLDGCSINLGSEQKELKLFEQEGIIVLKTDLGAEPSGNLHTYLLHEDKGDGRLIYKAK